MNGEVIAVVNAFENGKYYGSGIGYVIPIETVILILLSRSFEWTLRSSTLGVYSNLAATYDAMGRIADAIEILEQVLKLREEKLGIANPDFEDERKRLAELLKEAGRSQNHKAKSLQNLIDPNARPAKKGSSTKKWHVLGFKF